jgi:hypothetical protein
MTRASFQNVAQLRSPEVPGSGVSMRVQVSPGRAPVWSELEAKMMPGDSAKEQT